jgi:hypothetical protein
VLFVSALCGGDMSTFTSVRFNHEYLDAYLDLVEDTESPRLFHIWTAMSIVAGALGRRCFLPFGEMPPIYPNMYVALVGDPGTRKSVAVTIGRDLLRKSTNVRFAPSDSSGQRQGIIAAMTGLAAEEDESGWGNKKRPERPEQPIRGLGVSATLASMTQSQEDAPFDVGPEQAFDDFLRGQELHEADESCLFAAASELTLLVGQAASGMLEFLSCCWDGSPYEYQTKGAQISLDRPLLNILSGTTPHQIFTAFPAASIGQGFTSRMIFVYGAERYKSVPRPVKADPKYSKKVRDILSYINQNMEGAFEESDEAKAYDAELYTRNASGVEDARFQYYRARRQTHLIKLAMCVAASRLSMKLELADYKMAHTILYATEHGMPDALGQYGLSPISKLKQAIVDFLRAYEAPCPAVMIRAALHRDIDRAESFVTALNDLAAAKDIIYTNRQEGDHHVAYYTAKVKKSSVDSDIFRLLAQA